MIRVDLFLSTVASFIVGGDSHVLDVRQGCVTCTAARKMLKLGVDPAEEIDVRRNGKPVFTPIRSVAWWAALTVVEDDEQEPTFRLLTPTKRPHSDNSASRVSDPPEDKTPVAGPSIPGVK